MPHPDFFYTINRDGHSRYDIALPQGHKGQFIIVRRFCGYWLIFNDPAGNRQFFHTQSLEIHFLSSGNREIGPTKFRRKSVFSSMNLTKSCLFRLIREKSILFTSSKGQLSYVTTGVFLRNCWYMGFHNVKIRMLSMDSSPMVLFLLRRDTRNPKYCSMIPWH